MERFDEREENKKISGGAKNAERGKEVEKRPDAGAMQTSLARRPRTLRLDRKITKKKDETDR